MTRKDSHKANPLASIPVIVMLAMAPLSMDGKQFVPIDNVHLTEVSAQVNSVAPKAYAEPQAPQETTYPFGLNYYNKGRLILKVIDSKANNKDAKMVFSTFNNDVAKNKVAFVHLIDKDYNNRRVVSAPPVINELIYHNTSKGEFCSVVVSECIKVNNQYTYKYYNVKLDDNSAQELINLLAGETEWKNSTDIKFSETTSSELKPDKILSQH